MKFVAKNSEEGVVILPETTSSQDQLFSGSSQMNSEGTPQAAAPKRTITESGAIVLTPGTEGEVSHMDSMVEDETPTGKRRKTGTGKAKRFRAEWLSFEMFKGWLKAHPNPERAMCSACNIVLNAGKSELEKHATSIKHQKRMIEYKQTQQPQHHLRFDYSESDGNVILVDADTEEKLESSFIQRNDAGESAYQVESNYNADHTFSSSVPLTSHGRRTVEPPSFTSKAIVTKPAPPWKATAIVNGHVTRLELNDYKGRYLVLFFYPQDFSTVCPTELLALSDRVLDFRALQAEIVACSVDSHLTHLAWARTPRSEGGLGNPKIPLLADPTHGIARDYGVLLPDLGHALRAHFIIDRRGILRHMQVNDLGVGRSIDELLRITQALQHVDETETGCPADWKPGMSNV